jgi:predicted dehydrogenase/threonine dehydrogenase-like Zn-dependent dehydrogenase
VKQLAQYQDGRLELQEVPQPVAPPGGVLIQTTHSVISAGTERMKVEQAKMNLVQKALARPDQVRKVIDTARNLGWRSALEKVRNRLETPTPLGYSAAGIVREVDPGNTRFRVGDRVACGGTECAFHAEYVGVPDMLVSPVPDGVENWQAAYTTLCAIAMQAARQADPQIGERVLVIGQGLIGLLVTAMLRANGVRVMAMDVAEARRPFAEAMGAERVVIAGHQKLADEAREWTQGIGVDAALVCTAASAPIEQAADVLRDRGRLVIVGITTVELPQKVFYEKELEVRYSRSYGPGRYDAAYEWGGSDYPVGYVRWTEQRNFQACLHLMASRQLNLAPITTRRVPFADALGVYQDLLTAASQDIGVVLEYAPADPNLNRNLTPNPPPQIANQRSQIANQTVSRLDVIGAGNFARTMLLPHVQGKIALGTVVNQTALSANHVMQKFGFKSAATDHGSVFTDNAPAAVLIATRHHLHAPLVIKALEAGRHVFVEKPLCLNRDELARVNDAVARSTGTVMVGFNRRFAPATVELKRELSAIAGAKSATYHVCAGPLDPHHWYANYAESGGRIVGEACHFLDYFCFLFDAAPVRVTAQPIAAPGARPAFPDSVAVQVEFSDGSSGHLIYTAQADPSYPKETLTVFGPGISAEITNFQKLVLYRNRKARRLSYSSKGHAEEMQAWLAFLRGKAPHPLPYAQSRQSMQLTFAVLESIQQSCAVQV